MNVDVLVVVPPQARPRMRRLVSKSYPATTFPIDSVPLRVSSVLERDGYKVGYLPLYNYLLDFSVDRDADIAASFLKKYEFDFLLQITDYHISLRSTPCFPSMLLLSTLAKQHNPNAKVILAGKHVSVIPFEPFEKSDTVDVVAIAECESSISAVVETLQKGHSLCDIPAIVYKTHSRVKRNEGYGIVTDLDELPPPSYHLLHPHLEELHKWSKTAGSRVDLSLRTSNGCAYNCAFCSHAPHHNDYRVRNAEKIKEDIEYARKTLPSNVAMTYFDDELITYNPHHLHNLGNIMEELDTKVVGTLTSVQLFNRDIAKDLSRICSIVMFGAENANEMVLKTVNKGITLSKVIKACEVASENSLETMLFWMVGLPNETKRVVLENLNAMHSLIMKDYAEMIQTLVFTPYPGSQISEHPQKYGITIHHTRWEEYDEDGGYPVHSTRDLTREEIYLYYLMSQMVINEASIYHRMYENAHVQYTSEPGDPELFERFLDSRTEE